MLSTIKKIIKWLIPIGFIKFRDSLLKNRMWSGDYSNWIEAQEKVSGYNSTEIFEKVLVSTKKVIAGEAIFERDSVTFNRAEYIWQILTGLYIAANKNNGKVNVLDFGGGLGSIYYQHRKLLKDLDVVWNVVEQKELITLGTQKLLGSEVNFFYTIQECCSQKDINVFLFSSVLQYLSDPFEVLKEVVRYHPQYLIIDRLPIINRLNDRITIQAVPESIYKASYPCRFFNENNFLEAITGHYELIADFTSSLPNPIYFSNGDYAHDKGFIFKLKGLT